MKNPFNFRSSFDYAPKNNRKCTRGRQYKFVTTKEGNTRKVWNIKES